jgi:hypothetical protein
MTKKQAIEILCQTGGKRTGAQRGACDDLLEALDRAGAFEDTRTGAERVRDFFDAETTSEEAKRLGDEYRKREAFTEIKRLSVAILADGTEDGASAQNRAVKLATACKAAGLVGGGK